MQVVQTSTINYVKIIMKGKVTIPLDEVVGKMLDAKNAH